jgi:hypothetical protein
MALRKKGQEMNIATCPFCKNQVVNEPRLAGKVIVCPHCKNGFQMPDAPPPVVQPDDPLGFLSDADGPSFTAQTRDETEFPIGDSPSKQWAGACGQATSVNTKRTTSRSTNVTPGIITGGIAIGVIALGLIAMTLHPSPDAPAPKESGSQKTATAERQITVDEFRDNMKNAILGKWYQNKGEFFAEFGRPQKIFDIGDTTILMYPCADGVANVKFNKGAYQSGATLICIGVDHG